MMNQQRIIYVKNIIIYIITTIYVIALHFYNIKIYRIQNRYSNKIYAALETVKDQDFLIYFALGLFFIILLIYSAISSFRYRYYWSRTSDYICCYLHDLVDCFIDYIF